MSFPAVRDQDTIKQASVATPIATLAVVCGQRFGRVGMDVQGVDGVSMRILWPKGSVT